MHLSHPILPPRQIFPNTTISPQTCGFPGNNDIYGPGIRIGIYSQILAVWFASYFLLSEALILRDSVTIFSVTILIVAFIYSAHPSDVYAVEGFVLLMILAWACMMGVRAKFSYSSGVFSKGSLARRVVCELLNLANLGLQVWFWWVGVGNMKETPCGTWVLMYVVKTELLGWARKVMMAMSLFALIVTAYWMCVEGVRVWGFWKGRVARREFDMAIGVWMGLEKERDEVRRRRANEQHGEDAGVTSGERISHDGCSKFSCLHCSPTRSEFNLQQLQDSQSRTSTQADNHSKRTSYISTLETSSPPTPTSPLQEIIHTTTHASLPNLQLLNDVLAAEHYITHCTTASPYRNAASSKPLTLPLIIQSILHPSKYRQHIAGSSQPPSWLRCHIHTRTALLTFRFPPQAWAIYSHLRQASLLDPLNGPFMSWAAITYAPLPPHAAVTLASSMLLDAPTRPKKVWLGWYYAALDLAVHVVVILQLELTLKWNSVSGLDELWGSVGQLIPFVIGVGGLGLVILRWGSRLIGKRRGKVDGWGGDGRMEMKGNDEEGDICGLDGEVRRGYERWKRSLGGDGILPGVVNS